MLDAEQALLYAASPSTYVAPSRTAPTLDDARIRECALILGRPLPEQPEPEPEPEQPAADGGGGGAMSALWVLLLAVAMLTLLRRPRAAGRRHSR
jgi:hypothetical protein